LHFGYRGRTLMRLMVIFLLGLAGPIFGQSAELSHLTQNVENYRASGISRLDAIIRLGEEYKIPLGIDLGDAWLLQSAVVDVQQGTVQQVLSSLLKGTDHYHFSEQDGVVVIEPVEKQNGILQTVIPDFNAVPGTAQNLSNLLYMDLILQLDPSRQSFFGVDHPQSTDQLQPELHLKNKSVKFILNTITARAGNLAWVAGPAPSRESMLRASSHDLWNFVFYAWPPRPLSSLCCYVPKAIPQ
jgi:hypothetical protein